MIDLEIFREYLPQIIASVALLLLTYLSKYLYRKLVRKYGSKKFRSEVRISQITRLIGICVNLTCAIILMIIWGVQPQNILVALSSIFAVIGVALFAQWSILSNITAGIIMFFSTPFRIGDEIEIMDKDFPINAVIENALTFVIHLRTDQGQLVILSNSQFLQKTVVLKNN